MSTPDAISRRLACALLALAPAGVGLAKPQGQTVHGELKERFALKRRAYQSGDVELLRGFYAPDVAIVGEGMGPLLGLDAVLAAYRQLLPKRRDIEVQPLRELVSAEGDMACQFVRFTAYSKDPAESLPIVTFLFLWQRRPEGLRCVVELLLRQDLSQVQAFATLS